MVIIDFKERKGETIILKQAVDATWYTANKNAWYLRNYQVGTLDKTKAKSYTNRSQCRALERRAVPAVGPPEPPSETH